MQGGGALVSLLTNPQCCLQVLVLSKCHLGLLGVLRILQALSENLSLEDLYLADNANLDKFNTLQYDSTVTECSKSMQTNHNMSDSSFKISLQEEVEAAQRGWFAANSDQLGAADSEDDPNRMEPAVSGSSEVKRSSWFKIFPLPLVWQSTWNYWILVWMGSQWKLQKCCMLHGHQLQELVWLRGTFTIRHSTCQCRRASVVGWSLAAEGIDFVQW